MQPGEECAETGYPNHEVAVFFRVLLRVPEYCGVQNIELNMIPFIVKIGLDKSKDALHNNMSNLSRQYSVIPLTMKYISFDS